VSTSLFHPWKSFIATAIAATNNGANSTVSSGGDGKHAAVRHLPCIVLPLPTVFTIMLIAINAI
jgi:hypothetical protein